ncbi:VOC family protein [Rhodococcus pseudokoreensis]|uniref:VOC family protein n=1 Tax=Rhodococcus pseudokoreensis TaxID=2811421 RepID=A0A974ZWI3_9NOCA|nr:VOC family protein [Rhodococcus pseudokoreensis]QSE92935.1 VOC family protein [Rhodococcus pseudokoreensis]
MTEDSKTHINGVHTVAVPVTDQDRSLEFYVGTLGFERRMDAEFGPGQRWVEVAPPGSATSIALVPTRDGVPVGVETGIRLTTSDADADHATLSASGVDVDAAVLRMGDYVPPMFYFRDPDGNKLVIVEVG